MDCHGIFRRNDDHWSLEEQLAAEQRPTQVGQALRGLGIKAIFALSPQAKGRVERLFNILQDRLVQELRLAGSAHRKTLPCLLTARSKPISMRALPSPPEKAKAPGGRCPKGSMSIGSAASAIKLRWATIMRFGWEE
jgi:hypothetical protein